MQEAAEKVIDFALNTIKVQKMEAFFNRDNQHSLKLLQKLSFKDSHKPGTTDPDLIIYYLANSVDSLA